MITMLWGLTATALVAVNVMSWLPRWWIPAAAGAVLALLSVLVQVRFGADPALAAWWWLAVTGVVLALIDSLHHRLPHPWTASLLIGGLVIFGSVRPDALPRLVAASAVILLVGVLVQCVLPGQVGFGDTLLLVALAPYWAWSGWHTVLAGVITAHLVLGACAATAWLAGVRGPSARVAAGPGLLLGAWLPLLA
ncbi:prepilin peptidase [Saccharopolyspora sp. NFXS83]|uniref:prepilin peptidase n=1 Tax=Saccharopolyspora sp. NFXS83 TaxID=2993560 RepID=UPI00224A69FA|nr:prepilin peptidase [Saccharopolyspora sp. NFXS83]MCX2729447.1 prepilin peptidase [Saccharopolyspora sp. NFXS83]